MADIPKDLQKKIEHAVALEQRVISQMVIANELQTELKHFWKEIESGMINNDIKSFKGDWGSLSIAERMSWETDLDKLPRKYIKKVADVKKLSDTYKLEKKSIPGANPKFSRYLIKRFK